MLPSLAFLGHDFARPARRLRGLMPAFWLGLLLLPLGQALPAAAGQGTLPLNIRSTGAAQTAAPVFTGIPFPPGACSDVNQIELLVNDQPVARQVKLLSAYPDGSVRVALVGFRATLAAGETATATLRYGYGPGAVLSPAMAWTRNLSVLALCPPRWYGESGVFGLRFLAGAENTLYPAFETALASHYAAECDPPSDTNPDNRNYYDHLHALYMTLLRGGGSSSAPRRIWDEVSLYRESEILHSGTYRGQYQAGSNSDHGLPIPVNIVRRMYAQGLLEDYYFSGDERSLAVAQEIGEAFIADAYQQGATFTYTERTPGFALIGLCALYEATLDGRYLDAARNIATLVLNHQDAMAIKYPNQGGISGQTGGFIQDFNGVWNDPAESDVAGAGSPFMTTLLCEGLIKLFWLTEDPRTRIGILRACDWLADAAFAAAGDPNNLEREDSFWYVAVDPENRGTTPSLNPMFLQMLGFAHQATADPKYRALAQRILAVNDWGHTIKEFNQNLRTSGQGLYLLQNPAGSVPLSSAGAATAADPLLLLSDNFNDNSRDTVKWVFGTITGAITSASAWDAAVPVREQNQRLETFPRAGISGLHYNAYISAASWNATNANLSVEVIQAANGDADTAMALGSDSQNFYMMAVEAGRLYCVQLVNGARTATSVGYNATAHRFWRIRHDATANTIVFETSPDRTNWTAQRTVPRQLTLTAMKVELGTGTWGPVASPGMAAFDDVRLALNSAVPPPTNQPPVVRPGGPYSATTGQGIAFNGSSSADPDGTLVSYQWSFGDGGTATGANPTRSYATAGTFTVTLTVTDNQGATSSATTTATISAPPPPPLSDDFNDNLRDATKWTLGAIVGTTTAGPSAWDTGVAVLEQNGRLEITPRAQVPGLHFNGYVSAATWDLTGSSASVEVVQVASGTADTSFAVAVDVRNFYLMEVESGRLYFTHVAAGARSQTNIPHSATGHRFWRIRHDAVANTVLYETSADRNSWTTQRTVSRQFPVTAVRIELSAGTWESVSNPGKAIFDNLRMP